MLQQQAKTEGINFKLVPVLDPSWITGFDCRILQQEPEWQVKISDLEWRLGMQA